MSRQVFSQATLVWAIFAGAAFAETEQRGTAGPIPDAIWDQMLGVSWHSALPCPARAELRLLQLPFVDFYGEARDGQMIVAATVADDVLDIFAELFAAGYPIQNMRLVHEFDGNDDLSMAANNTSAFNCRVVGGTDRLSQHALGLAIDINPVQNPFVTQSNTSPAAGADYDDPAERMPDVPGVVTAEDSVVKAFKSRGWGWGGDWSTMKDYQHFSASGK